MGDKLSEMDIVKILRVPYYISFISLIVAKLNRSFFFPVS